MSLVDYSLAKRKIGNIEAPKANMIQPNFVRQFALKCRQ